MTLLALFATCSMGLCNLSSLLFFMRALAVLRIPLTYVGCRSAILLYLASCACETLHALAQAEQFDIATFTTVKAVA